MNCWICEVDLADTGEHALLKAVYERFFGKLGNGKKAYFRYVGEPKNTPVSSFKNSRFKFAKSLCQKCNNVLTQPYDIEFLRFVEKLRESKGLVISRNKVAMATFDHNRLGLYLLKVFGCLLVEGRAKILAADFKNVRHSLISGHIQTDKFFLSAHRDFGKLGVKTSTTISMYPILEGRFSAWLLDLDWISFVISYPFPPPEAKYGKAWRLGEKITYLPLGKISEHSV